jgi:hypothetical protein
MKKSYGQEELGKRSKNKETLTNLRMYNAWKETVGLSTVKGERVTSVEPAVPASSLQYRR